MCSLLLFIKSLGKLSVTFFIYMGFWVGRAEKHSRDTPPAEPQVGAEVAPRVARALEVQAPALHEPLHLERHARPDEGVEVAVGVLEGEGVGVDEVLGDEEVDLRGEVHESGAGAGGGWCRVRAGGFWARGFGGAAEAEEGHDGGAGGTDVDLLLSQVEGGVLSQRMTEGTSGRHGTSNIRLLP